MLFTKEVDKASSKLLRACSAGTVYPKVIITFYRAYGGKGSTATSQQRVDYFKITLEDVVISSVNVAIGDGDLPAETFGLKYGKVVWEYKQHKMDGSSASTGPAGWDLRKNIAT
jgi:type VI secretion system secreted protein Hcp